MLKALVFPRLAKVSRIAILRILDDLDIKPHKIEYYCERRDPEFDEKMHNVLVVCEQLSFNFDENGDLTASESTPANSRSHFLTNSLEHSGGWGAFTRSSA